MFDDPTPRPSQRDLRGRPHRRDGVGSAVRLDADDGGTVSANTPPIGAATAIERYFYALDATMSQIHAAHPACNGSPPVSTTTYAGLRSAIIQRLPPGGDFDWTLLMGLAGTVTISAPGQLTVLSHLPPVGIPEPAGVAVLLTERLAILGAHGGPPHNFGDRQTHDPIRTFNVARGGPGIIRGPSFT